MSKPNENGRSGSKALRNAGYIPMTVYLNAEQLVWINAAAMTEGMSKGKYIAKHAAEVAERMLAQREAAT